MITAIVSFFRRWRQRRAKEKQLRACREDGHTLNRCGEMTPGRMVDGAPVATGKPEFWLFSCKCGYGEANDVGVASPYRRPWDEAERMKKTDVIN